MASQKFLTVAPTDGSPMAMQLLNTGRVPYFVSGPLHAKYSIVGVVGALLHVSAWLCAIAFDIAVYTQMDVDMSPIPFTMWMYGFIAIMIGFIILLLVTVYHFFSAPENRIPEGAAPPSLMTLFIGGAHISLIFSILQLINNVSNGASSFDSTITSNATLLHIPTNNTLSLSVHPPSDAHLHIFRLTAFSMIFKLYIVQFLRNNQEWAGPADELKKDFTTYA